MNNSNWDESLISKEFIQEQLLNFNCKFIGYNVLNGKSSSINSKEVQNYDLILGYDNSYKMYFAWNPRVHYNMKTDTCTFTIGTKGKEKIEKRDIDAIYPIYKSLHNRNGYEKVLLIHPNFLLKFCDNWYAYLLPSKNDENYEVNCMPQVSNSEELLRNRVSCTRAERSAKFRRIILSKYNYTCIVCGCKEINLLQAAHIKSVADGGDDSEENGYCLCANHHLLFDAGKLTIDMQTKTFHCEDTTEMESLWYKEAEKRNFSLFL